MKTNRKKINVFVDTNVLIGEWAKIPADVACMARLRKWNAGHVYVSTLSVAQMVATLANLSTGKRPSVIKLRQLMRLLNERYHLVECSADDIKAAAEMEAIDPEDSIQCAIAQKAKCEIIITNNLKDFRSFLGVQSVSPSMVSSIWQ